MGREKGEQERGNEGLAGSICMNRFSYKSGNKHGRGTGVGEDGMGSVGEDLRVWKESRGKNVWEEGIIMMEEA